MGLGPNLGLLVRVINRLLKILCWQFYEIFILDTIKRVCFLVLVWNLRFLPNNSILCGESSSTYQSQLINLPNWLPSFLKLKIGSANQGSINWYQSFGSWNPVLSIVCVFCFMCVSSFVCSVTFLFNFILLFYLPLFYFFESIFLFWTISSINIFLSSFFFINIELKFMQKKGKKKEKKKRKKS